MTIRRRKPLRPRESCPHCSRSLCACGKPVRLKKSRVNPINRERRDREWARAYGSVERVEEVRAMRSVVSGKTPCVNAHVTTGGTGRKADARWVVPLTHEEHMELHAIGLRSFEAKYGVDLKAEAERLAA